MNEEWSNSWLSDRPPASNLLAKTILCDVDAELSPRFKYIRSIDDYVCMLANYAKTLAHKGPNTFDPLWLLAYNAFSAADLKGDWADL